MKPPIEFRPGRPAPKWAAKAGTAFAPTKNNLKRKPDVKPQPDLKPAGVGAPKPKDGGRWVWVPDDQICSLRNRNAARDRMRDYMRKRRASKKQKET